MPQPETTKGKREWLVIESCMKRAVFSDGTNQSMGYIPRDAAEKLLGRDLGGDRCVWFTREEGDLMRAHPEWTAELSGPVYETAGDAEYASWL